MPTLNKEEMIISWSHIDYGSKQLGKKEKIMRG